VETLDHLDAIRLESGRFSRAARGPLDASVPSCPDWRLGDLVRHLGGVQWFWAEVVRTRATDRGGIPEPRDVPDDLLPAWFDEVSAGLIAALASSDAGTRVWSWAGG
jgi:mycothiol maleylpyruvate isomerase-like protein